MKEVIALLASAVALVSAVSLAGYRQYSAAGQEPLALALMAGAVVVLSVITVIEYRSRPPS